jgi:hypothetical protein
MIDWRKRDASIASLYHVNDMVSVDAYIRMYSSVDNERAGLVGKWCL